MNGNNTTERVREFIRMYFANYAWLEGITGIAASKWRDLDRGRTKAVTAEMIDEICRCWPEFAYWFVTGDESNSRGLTSPERYFGLEHNTVSVLVPNGCKLWRDSAGKLFPDLGSTTVEDRSSKSYEISAAERILYFSAVANEYNAHEQAEEFWTEFIQPLKRGEQLVLRDYELKKWMNQYPILVEPTERYKSLSRQSFHAMPADNDT